MANESDNLKRLQKRVLSIYKEIKILCDNNDIRFFAIGGTAIGAVRHQGFIPWDDDIDIVMPRKDYEKFKKLANQLPERLRFVDYADNPDSPLVFSKVQDIASCYTNMNDVKNPNTYYGIFVDIMPMDGVPNGEFLYKLFRLRLRVLLLIQNMILQYEYGITIPADSTAKKTVRNICGILSKIKVLNKTKLKNKYLKLVKRHPLETAKYTACLWQFIGAGVDLAARYPVKAFSSHIDMPFETVTMRMPISYDEYFAAVCPNYMTPPPKDKQVSHHSGIIDFNKSYLEYAKEARRQKDKDIK